MISAIANHLWHCTLFAMLAALITVPLRPYQAKVRYWVWFAASVKFVIPFSALMSFGALTAPTTRPAAGVSWASPAAVRMAQPFGLEPVAAMSYRPVAAGRDWVTVLLATLWLC